MDNLQNKLRLFAEERDWDNYHTPKNLVMALSGEIGELTEIFQWLNEDESKIENLSIKNIERVKEEIADVFLYLIRLSDKLNIDLILSFILLVGIMNTLKINLFSFFGN